MTRLSDQVAAVEHERDRLAGEKATMAGLLVELAKGYRPIPFDPDRLTEVARKRLRHLEAMEEMAERQSADLTERNESANLLRLEQAKAGVLRSSLATAREELSRVRRELAASNGRAKRAETARDVMEGWIRRELSIDGPWTAHGLAQRAQSAMDKLRAAALAATNPPGVPVINPVRVIERAWMPPGGLPLLLGVDGLGILVRSSEARRASIGTDDQVAVEATIHGDDAGATIDVRAWIPSSTGIHVANLRHTGPRVLGTLAYFIHEDAAGHYVTHRRRRPMTGPLSTTVELIRMRTGKRAG